MVKNNDLLDNAKKLRKNMTAQEKRLWYDFLRTYPIKIYRQRIIDDYIVDFYCHQVKLVIEIDGSHHFTEVGKKQDELRAKIFSRMGLQLLRYPNSRIENEFDLVCSEIDGCIRKLINDPT